MFSFFKYANRKVFLFALLKSELGLDITEDQAVEAELTFWPRYEDNTEPDLTIEIGEYYLLVEAKYLSKFGKKTAELDPQLVREVSGGMAVARNRGKVFRLIAVTAHHYFAPEIFKDIPEDCLQYSKWINWQQISLFIRRILEHDPPISPETRYFAEDFYQLLVNKNLRNYAGTSLLGLVPQLHAHTGEIFFIASTSIYRGDFFGFIDALTPSLRILPRRNRIFIGDGVELFVNLLRGRSRIIKCSSSIFYMEAYHDKQ